MKISRVRLLEVMMGLIVLVTLCAVILIVIRDNQKIRSDRVWIEEKFVQLQNANETLITKLGLIRGEHRTIAEHIEEEQFNLLGADGYYAPSTEEADACDAFVVPAPDERLTALIEAEEDGSVRVLLARSELTETLLDSLVSSSSTSLVHAVLALKSTPVEGCDAGNELIGVLN